MPLRKPQFDFWLWLLSVMIVIASAAYLWSRDPLTPFAVKSPASQG